MRSHHVLRSLWSRLRLYKLRNTESRCSFCVVAQDNIVPEEFTTYFRSVIVAGRIIVLTDSDEIRTGLVMLSEKYCPGIDPTKEIDRFINVVKVLRIDIDSITGKESIELVRQNENNSDCHACLST